MDVLWCCIFSSYGRSTGSSGGLYTFEIQILEAKYICGSPKNLKFLIGSSQVKGWAPLCYRIAYFKK